ncbi:PAP2 family protein, partial [Pseudomonas syringae]
VWLSALLTALAFYGWRQLAQPLETTPHKPLN